MRSGSDLATETTRQYTLHNRRSPSFANGALSPDGEHLALAYAGTHPTTAEPARLGLVLIIDLGTGEIDRIEGIKTGAKHVASLAWTPDGGALAMSLRWRGHTHLAVYDPESRQLTRLPVRLKPSASGALLALR